MPPNLFSTKRIYQGWTLFMAKHLTPLILLLTLTACGSDNDSNNNLDLSGTWKRDNMSFNELRADHTWRFSSDGSFTIDNVIYHEGEEGIVAPAFEGTFSLGSSINTPSGQTAIELNLIFNTPRDSAFGIGGEDSPYVNYGSDAPPVYEIVYLQDGNLYFGSREVITTEGCSDLYLLSDDDAYQEEYLTDYDGVNPTYLVDRTNCHIRPTQLDFDNVLFKVE
jgi:hypothetical protein